MYFYLASPYAGATDGLKSAYSQTLTWTAALLQRGVPVLSPIAANAQMYPFFTNEKAKEAAKDFSFWQELDFSLLDRSDGLIVLCLKGWPTSKGVGREITRAITLGLDVYYFDPAIHEINNFAAGMRAVTARRTKITSTEVYSRIEGERQRQLTLKAEGRFTNVCSDPELSDSERYLILMEEVGELARAINEEEGLANDKHGAKVFTELNQVAAVAASWLHRFSLTPNKD